MADDAARRRSARLLGHPHHRVTAPSTAWPPPRSPPAASANPLLKTLVAAVTKAKLVDTLNSAEDITVFAPTDDAFAKIPKKTLTAVLKDKATLTTILTHHVVAGQLGPDELAGEHETLAGDMLTGRGIGRGRSPSPATMPRSSAATSRPPTPRSTWSTTVLMPAS
jgi:hypothetical protein